MKNILKLALIIAFTFSFAACNTQKSNDPGKTSSKITIKNAWARTANKNANSAVYLTVLNSTSQPDTLVGVKTDAAKMAGIHRTYHSQGMTEMKEVNTLVIEANSNVTLKPGGYHIMLMNLNHPIHIADTLEIKLFFGQARGKTVKVPVKPVAVN